MASPQRLKVKAPSSTGTRLLHCSTQRKVHKEATSYNLAPALASGGDRACLCMFKCVKQAPLAERMRSDEKGRRARA